jgi:Ca-activated chloride channel family protein
VLATAALVAGGSISAQQEPVRPLEEFAVRLVSPRPDEVVSGRVELRAEVAADRVGDVLFVEFEVDGRVLFADSTAPYELIWNPREPAAHVIVARAFGPAGTVVEHIVRTSVPPPVPDAGAFRSRADQVEVYVHVGADGREFATADFALFENGVEQSLLAADHSADLPVALGFMLDSSGSMLRNLGYAIDTAGSFIDGIMARPDDKAFVMAFADWPAVLQQFTNDTGRLVTSLDLIDSGRYTRLYDSIVAAARQFDGHEGQRALVVLSDGRDSSSDYRLDDAIRTAQRLDVAIYPVAVGLSSRYFRERWVLQQLARDTGGDVFYLNSMDNPRRVYDRIARELREQYRLTYAPSEPAGDGEWRQIEVKLARRPGGNQRKLRARPGYWAQ